MLKIKAILNAPSQDPDFKGMPQWLSAFNPNGTARDEISHKAEHCIVDRLRNISLDFYSTSATRLLGAPAPSPDRFLVRNGRPPGRTGDNHRIGGARRQLLKEFTAYRCRRRRYAKALAATCLARPSQNAVSLTSIPTASLDAELIVVVAVLNAHAGAVAFYDTGRPVVGAHPAIGLGYGDLAGSSAKGVRGRARRRRFAARYEQHSNCNNRRSHFALLNFRVAR